MAELLDGLFTPRTNEKPRDQGITKTLTNTRINERFLDRYGRFIDVVKLLPQTFYLPVKEIRSDVSHYHEYDIEVTYSSVMMELATAHDCHDAFVDKMDEIGVDLIEYPVEEGLATADIAAEIDDLRERGFDVFAEIGSKWWWKDRTRMAVDEIDVNRTIDEFQKYIDAGVDHCDWEGYIPRNLIGRQLDNHSGQRDIIDVVDAVGKENITFEILGPSIPQLGKLQLIHWIVSQFGPDVNLGNVPVGQIPAVEAIRDGIRYEMDNPYIRWLNEGRPTEDYWQMPSPPYEVGLERDD